MWVGLCAYPIAISWFMVARPEIFNLNAEIEKSKSRDALGALGQAQRGVAGALTGQRISEDREEGLAHRRMLG